MLVGSQMVRGEDAVRGSQPIQSRGRRPTFLHLNDERVIIGVDIRPVQTTVALADVNGRFTSQEVIATPPDPKDAIDLLIQRIQLLRGTVALVLQKHFGVGNGFKLAPELMTLPSRWGRRSFFVACLPHLLRPRFPRPVGPRVDSTNHNHQRAPPDRSVQLR